MRRLSVLSLARVPGARHFILHFFLLVGFFSLFLGFLHLNSGNTGKGLLQVFFGIGIFLIGFIDFIIGF